MDAAIHELLSMSDKAERSQLNTDGTPTLSDSERAAIKTYCESYIKKDTLQKSIKLNSKQLREESKTSRKVLEDWMKDHNTTCAILPRSALLAAEKQLSSQGFSSQPCFVRLMKNNCDRTITPEVLDDVFRTLSKQDILEQTQERGEDALVEALLSAVRRNIRSYKEQCSLSESIERGKKVVNVPELPVDIAFEALRVHTALEKTKLMSSQKKETLNACNGQIKSCMPVVETVLEKLCVNSQNVEVSGQRYQLIKQVSTTKPRVTLHVVGDFLRETIQHVVGGDVGTKEDATKLLDTSREQLLRASLMKMAALPASRSSKVVLKSARSSKNEQNDDDDEGAGDRVDNAKVDEHEDNSDDAEDN